jgi:hypothetical protein
MEEITIQGEDGSLWRYYAVTGAEFSAAETGWVLTLARPGEPEPTIQALTVADVVGDLQAMMPEEGTHDGVVKVLTIGMIESLDKRVSEGEGSAEVADALRERADELRRELGEAFPPEDSE